MCVLFTEVHSNIYDAENSTVYTRMHFGKQTTQAEKLVSFSSWMSYQQWDAKIIGNMGMHLKYRESKSLNFI